MKHVAFPFLTLESKDIEASKWNFVDESRSIFELNEYLEGWDYARDLWIQRTFLLEHQTISARLGLDPASSSFQLVIRYGTGTGNLARRLVHLAQVEIHPGIPILVDEVLQGKQLSNRLLIESSILLIQPGVAASRLSPLLPGSIIWRDTLDVALEGSAPRFPMEIVSFSERFAGQVESSAPWMLHWLPERLDRDFGGSVRLYLNADCAEFLERFVAADRMTLQSTLAGVIAQMVANVIMQDELEETLAESDPTSVAGHIATWLALSHPNTPIANIRAMHEHNPGRFHAAILAMVDPNIFGAS